MATIQAAEKMGFYATPAATEALLCSLIKPAKLHGQVFALDPCCGEGIALASLAKGLGITTRTFGVELSDLRADEAKKHLTRAVQADLMATSISNRSFGLMLNNPPYDDALNSTVYREDREEIKFLNRTVDKLATNGVLIYIIPFRMLTHASTILASNFFDITVYRVAEQDWPQFQQIVVFARKRPKKVVDWNDYKDDCNALIYGPSRRPLQPEQLPFLEAATKVYEVPVFPAYTRLPKIQKISLSAEEMYRAFGKLGAHTSAAYRDFIDVGKVRHIAPAAPIKLGHLGGLIASGKFGTVNIGNMLIRGTVEIVTVYLDNEGNETSESEAITEVDRLVPVLFVVHSDGRHETIRDPQTLGKFFTDHAVALSKFIETNMAHLYAEPTVDEWQKIGSLALAKQIPGNDPGLTVAQKHASLASYRTLKKYGTVFLVGEQGTGKTVMGPAIVGMFPKPQKTVVLCPAHLVEKWAREVPQVIPGAKAIIAKSIADIDAAVADKTPWLFVILSKETAKLGSGWKPAAAKKIKGKMLVNACPKCGNSSFISYDLKKFCSATVGKRTEITDDGETKSIEIECGEPLHEFNNTYLSPVNLQPGIYQVPAMMTGRVNRLLQRAGIADYTVTSEPVAGNCVVSKADQITIQNGQLYKKSANHRWPLADYIRKQYPKFFTALIADECHKFNGHSSDQARAYHQLLCCTKYTINLTGTIMGGKATDLFWIFYRNLPEVRAEYDYAGGDSRWSGHYGRLVRNYKISDGTETGTAGRTRRKVGTREAPGINPAIYGIVLKYCVFLRVEDLGFNMPAYKEILTYVDTPAMVESQLDEIDVEMKEAMADRYGKEATDQDRHERMVLLGNWLQKMLGRPNSAFRRERVMWKPYETSIPFLASNGKEIDLPPVDGLLPKEALMIQRVKEQRAQGNKVLIYLRQTGEADIRPRLEKLLKAEGIKAVSLPDSVAASKREAWINKNIADIDVLLTNPRNVETGLDLIDFNYIIIFEPETSLYILWQAERRIWRPGQTKPCTVEYMVYRDTMEDRFVALMAEKKGAAYMLYGDDPGGALVTSDSDNILVELARKALANAKIERSTALQPKGASQNIWATIKIPVDRQAIKRSWAVALGPVKKPKMHQLSFVDL